MVFWRKQSVKSLMQNFWQKKKGCSFLISKIFDIRSTLYLVNPSLWTNALKCISIFFKTVQKACGHMRVIDFNHYGQYFFLSISRWFKSGVFQRYCGVFSRCERCYLFLKGCNSGASRIISWEEVVSCLAHSKEHLKTSLAEYWGWGGAGGGGGGYTVGQITSRTIIR